jgi:hypothetical protein
VAVLALVALGGFAAAQSSDPARTATYVSADPPGRAVPQGTSVDGPVTITYAWQEGSEAVSKAPTHVYVAVRDAASETAGRWLVNPRGRRGKARWGVGEGESEPWLGRPSASGDADRPRRP